MPSLFAFAGVTSAPSSAAFDTTETLLFRGGMVVVSGLMNLGGQRQFPKRLRQCSDDGGVVGMMLAK